jgi:hypothetical protein
MKRDFSFHGETRIKAVWEQHIANFAEGGEKNREMNNTE